MPFASCAHGSVRVLKRRSDKIRLQLLGLGSIALAMLPLLAFTAAVAIAAVLVVPETHPSVYDRLETPTEPGNTE